MYHVSRYHALLLICVSVLSKKGAEAVLYTTLSSQPQSEPLVELVSFV